MTPFIQPPQPRRTLCAKTWKKGNLWSARSDEGIEGSKWIQNLIEWSFTQAEKIPASIVRSARLLVCPNSCEYFWICSKDIRDEGIDETFIHAFPFLKKLSICAFESPRLQDQDLLHLAGQWSIPTNMCVEYGHQEGLRLFCKQSNVTDAQCIWRILMKGYNFSDRCPGKDSSKLVFDEINASNVLQKPHLAAIPENGREWMPRVE